MLVILPPSETKRPPPDAGPPLDLETLSFPELTPMRQRVLEALIATSTQPDGRRRLRLGPSLAPELARNEQLRELPTRHAVDTYAGPLYEGLDPALWSSELLQRADRRSVIVSALWGAIRPTDRIPAYRLHVCSWLVGMDRLEPEWRTVLPDVLASAAGADGPVLDLRSPSYQAMGRPSGLDEQTVKLRIRPSAGGPPHIGDVVAKRVRGEAAHHLLDSPADPEDPLDIADVLATRWNVDIEPPNGRSRSWTLGLEADPGPGLA
ncbi:MAG TPA: peroxide stress protein YaaA [Candidatus Limnocylindria bacterium]|jgi:cytoplasmic iron level regulating protein YaaA (DUF328/UPF0246 family)